MDFKQVYLMNGQPFLAMRGSNGEYQYPNDEWTETPPPAGAYQPMHYDGNKWITTSKSDWEANLKKEQEKLEEEKPPYEPNDMELFVSFSQLQIAKTAKRLVDMEQMQAELIMNITEKDNRIKQLEEQVAQLMLQVSKNGGVE